MAKPSEAERLQKEIAKTRDYLQELEGQLAREVQKTAPPAPRPSPGKPHRFGTPKKRD